jgi:hypothetical protein
VRVEDPGKIRASLYEALARPGPALVELVTDPNAMSIPPHITGEMVAASRSRRPRPSSTAVSARWSTSPAATHTVGGPIELSVQNHRALGQMLKTVGADPENEILILTGSGEEFMMGSDPEGFAIEAADMEHWANEYAYKDGRINVSALPWPLRMTPCSPARRSVPGRPWNGGWSTRWCHAISGFGTQMVDRRLRPRGTHEQLGLKP